MLWNILLLLFWDLLNYSWYLYVCWDWMSALLLIYIHSLSYLWTDLAGYGNALMWSQLTSRSDLLNNSVSSTQLMPLNRAVCESLPTTVYHCRILYLSPRRCNTYPVLYILYRERHCQLHITAMFHIYLKDVLTQLFI